MLKNTSALHSRTPTLAVIDPRGLGVRSVAYLRDAEDAAPVPRVQRAVYGPKGFKEAHWDPRLWAQHEQDPSSPPNGTTVCSLSGKPLHIANVDAGWRVSVFASPGLPARIWDSRGSTQSYAYDQMLRPVATRERMQGLAERCVERFTYGTSDAPGNRRGLLIRHDDPAGTRTATEYSLAGLPLDDTRRFLAAVEVPDWPEDVAQREALLEGEAWTTHRHCNPLGEVLLHSDARGNTQRTVRGVDGTLGQVWLGLAGGNERCLLSEMAFDAEGAPLHRIDGNGIVRQWEYAATDHRLMKATVRRDRDLLQDLAYTYDAVGNVVSMSDAAQPTTYFAGRQVDPVNTYTYDSLYQLIAATGRESVSPATGPDVPAWQLRPGEAVVGFQQTFAYDAGGNLLSLRHVGATSYTRRMAVATDSNRSMPLEEGQPPPDLAGGFDPNGNLLHLPGMDLAWNARNMLSRTVRITRKQAANDEAFYLYNGTGHRVRKLQTTLVAGQPRQRDVRYLPGLEWRTDEITGERLQVICTEIDGGTVRTLHWEENTTPVGIDNDSDRYQITDRLGSCTLEIDGAAALISQEWYHPYGSTAGCVARSRIEAAYKTVHYAGKERDDSGLHYYGFRYYATWLMRWINPDPAGDIDGPNRFVMVRGNPVTFADASGLWSWEDTGVVAASMLRAGAVELVATAAKQFVQWVWNELKSELMESAAYWTFLGAGMVSGAIVAGALTRRTVAPYARLPRRAAIAAAAIAGAAGGTGISYASGITGSEFIGQMAKATTSSIISPIVKRTGPRNDWVEGQSPPWEYDVTETSALATVAAAAVRAKTVLPKAVGDFVVPGMTESAGEGVGAILRMTRHSDITENQSGFTLEYPVASKVLSDVATRVVMNPIEDTFNQAWPLVGMNEQISAGMGEVSSAVLGYVRGNVAFYVKEGLKANAGMKRSQSFSLGTPNERSKLLSQSLPLYSSSRTSPLATGRQRSMSVV